MSERLVAALDCGTNSLKLLVADLPRVVLREARVVRLGQGVDSTGRLADEALERTFAALDEFAQIIADHQIGPDRIRMCATSATRDAANAEVFAAGVQERLGVRPEVLSGDQEAGLVFSGTTQFLAPRPPDPVLVVDIGGGSTELVLGDASGPVASVSMDVGGVRLFERHLHSDPPTQAEIAACVADIDAALAGCGVDIAAAASIVGTSGTIKTIAAGLLDLPTYDRDAIDGADLRIDDTHAYVERLVAMTIEARKALGYMHPGRADVAAAGALIWSRILAKASVERYVVSEADLLYGIAAAI